MTHIIIAAAVLVLAFAALMFRSRGNVSHRIDYEAMTRRLDKLAATKAQKVKGRK